MSIIQGTAKSGGATAESFYDYPIEQSLRFDGASYLSRTFATPTDGTKYTLSFWVKRTKLGSDQFITGRLVLPYYDAGSNFNTGDNIIIGDHNAGKITSSAKFRDTSSWYHFISQRNDANGNLVLWANGVKVQETAVTGATSYNSAGTNVIGALYDGSSYLFYLNGYLANIQFIDGQALDQYFFGEFKDNIWVPYNAFSTAGSGTATASDSDTATDSYGTNGFHLDFADSSNIGNDVSGNNNDWTVN